LYTVTSSSAGEGKTHLALALGMSFAMSGRRTLLIDADLVGRALTSQLSLKSSKGLSEAVGAKTLNGEVHAVQPNLWALPVGIAADFRAEQLSSSMMTKLLDQAREAFDTIIIDSGPIMGSLEANLASSLSDRVVMVVARGQDSKAVRAALNRLRNIGATCAGLVFNRALSKDFARSVSAMSLSGRTSRRSKADAGGASTALARVLGHSKAEPGHGGKA
jgi:Mrp family chromosome partitioning ATPase